MNYYIIIQYIIIYVIYLIYFRCRLYIVNNSNYIPTILVVQS
jgi:hypothetical protein